MSHVMPAVHLQFAPAPFDAIAQTYDSTFTDSPIGRAQRSAVWQELEQVFHPGDHVLEIGCGTGVDACFLAERGVSVLACDSSPQMIQVAAGRVRERKLQFSNASVDLRVCAAEELAELHPSRAFDGAFSNFGALNCVQDLRAFARRLAAVIRPSGEVVLCLIGPCCLWEVVWFLLHGQAGRATRRFRRNGSLVKIGESQVQVQYPTVAALKHAFAPEFRLRTLRAIGLLVPPSYAATWTDRHPAWLRFAAKVDTLLTRFPGLRALGDHVLLTLERTSQ